MARLAVDPTERPDPVELLSDAEYDEVRRREWAELERHRVRKHGDHDQSSHGSWASGAATATSSGPPEGNRPSYAPWDDSKTEDENKAASDAAYAARDRWDAAMNRAVALGQIAPSDAEARGWSDDYARAAEVKPLPEVLYHATGALQEVMDSGLKTRDELGGREALGGGTSDTISFTTDRALAERIADVLVEASEVARGDISLDDIMERADALGVGDRIRQLPEWTRYERHVKFSTSSGLYTAADIAEREGGEGWVPQPGTFSAVGGDGVQRYGSFERPETPEEAASARFAVYTRFLAYQEEQGGPADPMFFGIDPSDLVDIDPANVGVVEARPKPGAMGYQVGGMAEWRTWTGETVTVTNLRKHGDHDQSEHGNWARGGSKGSWVEPKGLSDADFEERYGQERPKEGTGNCYEAAVHTIADILDPTMDDEAYEREKARYQVVHGVVLGRGELEGVRFDHAWVERTDEPPDMSGLDPDQAEMFRESFSWVTVIDRSNGMEVELPREVYYALGDVDQETVRRFTWDEAVDQMAESRVYGPW